MQRFGGNQSSILIHFFFNLVKGYKLPILAIENIRLISNFQTMFTMVHEPDSFWYSNPANKRYKADFSFSFTERICVKLVSSSGMYLSFPNVLPQERDDFSQLD